MQPKKILQLVAFTLLSFTLNATTFTFTGNGAWNDPSKWDIYPGFSIGSSDTVIIYNRCIIESEYGLVNNGVFISGYNAKIEVFTDFINNGIFEHDSTFAYFGITNSGVFTNNGEMKVSRPIDFWLSTSFVNYGSFRVNNTRIQSFADIDNQGLMEIGFNANFKNNRDFDNSGQVNLEGILRNTNNSAILNNNGDFTLFDSSEIELNGPFINCGNLNGNGIIYGPATFTNKGQIRPGFSPGVITFNNSELIEAISATTVIEISGSNPDDYDQILGTASKAITGNLNLVFEDGFTPSNGEMFSIFEGPLSGAFSQININGIDPDMIVELVYTPTGIDLMVDGALPLDLISFELQESNNSVEVNWETQNEIDFHGYMVERSTNQREWESIQFIPSKNQLTKNQYKFQDNGAKLGSNYYRLKMINLDESFEYTEIKHIKLSEENKAISIYPNPFVEQIHFDKNEAQNYEIYSDSGELVKTGFANNVNMMAFSVGKYYLKLGSQTIPIIKIK